MEILTTAENTPCWRAQCQVALVAQGLNSVMECLGADNADARVEVLDCDAHGFILRGGGDGADLHRIATPGQAAAFMLGFAWGWGNSGAYGAIDVKPRHDANGKVISWRCLECSCGMPAESPDGFYSGACYSDHATRAQAHAWAAGVMASC